MQDYITDRSKGCVAFDLTLLGLRCSDFNPTIDKLPDCALLVFSDNSMSWPGFCIGQYVISSCSLGIARYALVKCKLSVSEPTPAYNDSDVFQQHLSLRICLKPRSGRCKSRQISSMRLSQPHKDRQLTPILALTT